MNDKNKVDFTLVKLVIDNLFIIILTIINLINCRYQAFLIITSALIMIGHTFISMDDRLKTGEIIVMFILCAAFACLAGNYSGIVIFIFMKKFKIIYIPIVDFIFLVTRNYIYEGLFFGVKHILFYIIIVFVQLFIYGIYKGMDWFEKKAKEEYALVTKANINELHEKQLNEKLILQKNIDERNAILTERENISRNIHNSVGHSITAAIMTLEAADMLYDVKPSEARIKMQDANERIRGSLENIRRAVRVLDDEYSELAVKDLKNEMSEIVKEFAMNAPIEIYENYFDMADEITIPKDCAVFITGVLGECLSNGLKHGNANEFTVVLTGDESNIRLKVTDNGHSDFSKDNKSAKLETGFGLKKIKSFAEKAGGKAEYYNNNGFTSIIEMPIVREKNE